jgi:hypothetical protein
VRVRVRARQRLTGTPPARASRAVAAAPQLRPRLGPARPRARSPAAPHGAVSYRRAGVRGGKHPEEARAEGEVPRDGSQDPGQVASTAPAPPPPGWGERKVRLGVQAALHCWTGLPSPCLSFPDTV